MNANENDLNVLKVIAETLNRSNNLDKMLQSVLAELLKVTGLTTGWIFLVDDEKPYYNFVASHNLPPALSWENNKPMCKGTCFCLNKYWDEKLTKPVNIIECKRLEDANKYSWGETNGLTHHATVPLSAGEERFGILNVAAPEKQHFTEEELTLLQSVAYQIGTAIKRTKLYQSQKQRAENFALLDEVVRFTWGISDLKKLPQEVVQKCSDIFSWPLVAFYIREGNRLRLKAINNGQSISDVNPIFLDSENDAAKALSENKLIVNRSARHQLQALGVTPYQSSITVPLVSLNGDRYGVIMVADNGYNVFSESDREVLKALADHITLTIESIHVTEKREELLVYDERNRLARDLHDSVNQKLFSLSLTSRGMKKMLPQDDEALQNALDSMKDLAQSALAEMKSLIWQLRPVGLEEGLITALKTYGNTLGLTVLDDVSGVHNLPRAVEETLWRIGQEAFNNVTKHAATNKVFVKLQTNDNSVYFEVSDDGKGCDLATKKNSGSLGLVTMRERAELLGGTFSIKSNPNNGTTISVFLPIGNKEAGEQRNGN